MKKRLLALGLILVIVISLFSVTPVLAASNNYIQLLNDLGIIEPAQKTGLIKKGFTRGDFAKSLVLMDGSGPITYDDTDENGNAYATDIEKNANKDYIIEVIISGLMQTDAEGKFNPGKTLTKNDAARALIKALGYDVVVQKNGGTDSAYIMQASMLKLFKGVNIADESKLTHEEVTKILANAMSVRILDETDSYIDDGIECYFDYIGLTRYNGMILANSNFGIAIENTSIGYVNIDGKIIRTSILVDDKLVGSEVTYYTKEVDGYETVISIIGQENDDMVTVLIKDIYDIKEDRTFLTIYYNDKDKVKIEKSGYAIVNNITKQPTKKLFESLTSGSITFVKSEGSGNFDIAHITMLDQDVIDGISAQYGTLTLRYSGKKIDLSEPERIEIYVGKKLSDVTALKSGMPVGIACDSFIIKNDGSIEYDFSKAETIKLFASNTSITSIVDSIGSDGYTLDGNSYEQGYLFKKLLKSSRIADIQVNTGVKIYLDNYGQISYYEVDSALNSMKYGYLIGAAVSDEAFDKHIIFRIMDVNGIIKDYITKDKFVLDGKKVSADATSYNIGSSVVDLEHRQVIKFMQIDGIVKRIDTIALGSTENQLSTLKRDIECNAFDLTGANRYYTYNGVVDSRCALTDSTIVFVDEGNLFETTVPDNHYFSIMNISEIPERSYIECYDVNDVKEAGCAVIYTECGVQAGMNSDIQSPLSHIAKCYVVENVLKKLDENGDEAYGLICAGEGRKVELTVPEDTLKLCVTITNNDLNNDGDFSWASSTPEGVGDNWFRPQRYVDSNKFTSTISEGDIIRFRTSSNGNVNYIEKIFDFSEIGDKIVPVPADSGRHYGFVDVARGLENFYIYNQDTYDSNGNLIEYIVSSVDDIVPVYHVERGFVTMEAFSNIPTNASGQIVKAFVDYWDSSREPGDHIIYVFD